MLSGDEPLRKVCDYLMEAGHKIESLPVCILFHRGKPVDALVGRAQVRLNQRPPQARFLVKTHVLTCAPGFNRGQLKAFLEQQVALKGILRAPEAAQQERDAGPAAAAAAADSTSWAEKLQDLDPKVQERIQRAVAASTAKRKFGA